MAGPDIKTLSKISHASAYGTSAVVYLLAPVYPIILLVILNRRRVKAAFLLSENRKKPQGETAW